MIRIAIDRMPPEEVTSLSVGDPVLLALEDAEHVAYLTQRITIMSMPIVTGPDQCIVLFEGVLLSFAFEKPLPAWRHTLRLPFPGYEPPIYNCVVPRQ